MMRLDLILPRRALKPWSGRAVTVARVYLLCAIGVLALAASACGELEPMIEPEIIDLQLTLDTLKTQVRDAQRNLTDVRAELESRRQELAEAQVARAQLEGRVREAERRVTEARHIIELQREELMAARVERERVFRSSSHMQSQMRQPQMKAPKSGYPSINENGTIAPTGTSVQMSQKSVSRPSSSAATAVNVWTGTLPAMPTALHQESPIRYLIVKPGDTLYSLARKHRINLNRLRSLNHLQDNQINVGQTLWLSEE